MTEQLDIRNNTMIHMTEAYFASLVETAVADAQAEIDRLKLENQTLQDEVNGLRIQRDDIRSQLNFERHIHRAA